MFEMGLGADVREEVTQTALAQEIDVDLQRAAEPGDADDFAAGANGVEGLDEGLVAGEALLGAAAGAFENYVGADYAGQIMDRGNDVAQAAVERVVGAEFAGGLAGLVADIDRDYPARAATRSPGWNRVTPRPVSRMRAQNS